MMFSHPWFPPSQDLTYYEFFNKFNTESEKKDQGLNVKKFFQTYKPPLIPKTEQNQAIVHQLQMHTRDFSNAVSKSIRCKCCCCCSSPNNLLFGRYD